MTSSPLIERLAERCEKATGPDAQDALLQEAWATLFPKPDLSEEPEWQGPGTPREPLFHDWKVRQLAFQRILSAKAFLDAAMTLVPEGWALAGMQDPVFNRGKASAAVAAPKDDVPAQWARSDAATPALALCAAALRAKATSND